RDHRAGIDLRDLPVNSELGVLFRQHLCDKLQFVSIHRLLLVGAVQQAARGKLEPAGHTRHSGLRLLPVITAWSQFWLCLCGADTLVPECLLLSGFTRRFFFCKPLNPSPPRLRPILNWCRNSTRRNHLGLNSWLGGASFFKFPLHLLADTLIPPISPAVAQSYNKSKSRRRPHPNVGK